MLIRKKFGFECAHTVRNCSTERCSLSIHGHSYALEILLEASALDNGQMVYDFGLLKGPVRTLIDAFDHALLLWTCDSADYIEFCKRHSARWIALPLSPSAEQLSRIFFRLIDAVLENTVTANGECDVRVHSTIVHETATGYAQCFREDAFNRAMGEFALNQIEFSEQVRSEWGNPNLFDELLHGQRFKNRTPAQQVPVKKVIG